MSITPVASTINSCIKIQPKVSAKLDSGATKHFFKKEHLQFLKNVQKISNGPLAHLPNGTVVKATYEGTITFLFPMLEKSSKVLVFPHLTNESLVSIGQLCDDGCIVIFTKHRAYVTKNGTLLNIGTRNNFDGLWDIAIDSKTTQPHTTIKNKANYIIKKKKTKHDLASYYHASLFSPTISTLMSAITKGNLLSWPGIDELSFHKLLETTAATELGHLNQERKNLRSTKDFDTTQQNYFPTNKYKNKRLFCAMF